MKNKFNPLLDDGIQKITDHRLVFYDATVGTGGDYLTHALAFADGKRKVKQISDVTETVSPAINEDYYLEGNGFRLTCNYQLLKGSNLTIYNLVIYTNYVGDYKNFFISGNLKIDNVSITYNSLELQWIYRLNKIEANNFNIDFGTSGFRKGYIGYGFWRNSEITLRYGIMTPGAYPFIMISEKTFLFENITFKGECQTGWNKELIYIRGNTNVIINNMKNECSDNIGISSKHQNYIVENSKNIDILRVAPELLFNCENVTIFLLEGNVRISNSNRITVRNVNNVYLGNFIVSSSDISLHSANSNFEIHNLMISNSILDGTGISSVVFIFENLKITNSNIKDNMNIRGDAFQITNCTFEKDVTIENTALNTIFTNNRIAGTFTDNGLNSEIANNIQTI